MCITEPLPATYDWTNSRHLTQEQLIGLKKKISSANQVHWKFDLESTEAYKVVKVETQRKTEWKQKRGTVSLRHDQTAAEWRSLKPSCRGAHTALGPEWPSAPLSMTLGPQALAEMFLWCSLHYCSMCNLPAKPHTLPSQPISILFLTNTIHPGKPLSSSSLLTSDWKRKGSRRFLHYFDDLCDAVIYSWNVKRINWNKTPPSVSPSKWRAEVICRLLMNMHNHRAKLKIQCSWQTPQGRCEDMVAWGRKLQWGGGQRGTPGFREILSPEVKWASPTPLHSERIF